MRQFSYPETIGTRERAETRIAPPMNKAIPFDYVFKFELQGVPHNKVQDVVEISMQGVFVAVCIGYSLVPNERLPRSFPPVIDQTTTQSPLFAPLFENDTDFLKGLFVTGMPGSQITILDINPESPPHIRKMEVLPGLTADGSPLVKFVDALTPNVPDTITIGPAGIVSVIFDSGIPSGGFLRIWDRTNNLLSELVAHVSPTGILLSGTPDDDVDSPQFGLTPVIGPNSSSKRVPAAGDNAVDVYGMPGDNVNLFVFNNVTGVFRKIDGGPFDLASDNLTFPTRRTGHQIIPITTESVNQHLSPGDVLLVQSGTTRTVLPFSMFTIPSPRLSAITLGALAAGAETNGADLTCGVRLNPNASGFFIADLPLSQLSADTFDRLFESCCTDAEGVSFLYSIDILSTGRELQNEPIHNVAGLGIANGDRPFRPLARPIAFEPRSFIRIQIEELSGPPGNLYIVLQGYKTLGTGRIPE